MTEKRKNVCIWRDRKHRLWFPSNSTKYYITSDRLVMKKGLFITTVSETLLYRIADLGFRQTLAGKLFETGDVIVRAKVDATLKTILKNIKNPENVRNLIFIVVEESRQRRNMIGKEFYESDAYEHMGLDGNEVHDFDGMGGNE